MSKQSKRERRRLRKFLNTQELETQLRSIEELRAFVAGEIPALDSQSPWTADQAKAVARIYVEWLQNQKWFCVHDCGREVDGFGQQCPECLEFCDELGPVDWVSIGV